MSDDENRPPDEFLVEYRKMHEKMGWLVAGLDTDDGGKLGRSRAFIEEFRELYTKWRPGLEGQQWADVLDKIRSVVIAGIERQLEQIALLHLAEVIEAYEARWTGERLFRTAIAYIKNISEPPAGLRTELEDLYRAQHNADFDPISYYRQEEAKAAQADEKARQTLVAYAADWPERVNATLRQSLESLDGEVLARWRQDVMAGAAAVV